MLTPDETCPAADSPTSGSFKPASAQVQTLGQPPLSADETCRRLEALLEYRGSIGFDTEGQQWMTCCGFATHHPGTDRPWRCLVVDTLGLCGQPHAGVVWSLLRAILESKDVEKVCWFALHEREFLQLAHGIVLRGYQSAEMLFHERWPELPKSLKYAASILTRLPCWTEGISWSEDDDRPAASGELLWNYNAHDCVATLQIWLHPQIQELLR